MNAHLNGQSPDLLDLSESAIDWREIGSLLLEKSWLIVLCALAGFFAASAYVKRIPEVYRATAVLQFDPDEKKLLGFEDGQKPDLGEAGVQTIIEAFRSRSLLGKVAEANKLNEDPAFMALGPDGTPQTLETASRVLGGCIDVQTRRGTRLIDVSVVHGNPRIAQKLADSLTREFLLLTIEQRASSSQAVMRFLLGEAEKLKVKLRRSEEEIQSYKETQNASLEEKQDTVVTKLKSQSNQLSEAKAKRLRLGTENAEMKRLAGNPAALLALASVANNPAVSLIQQRIRGYESQITTLALRYTEKHPKMIQVRTELGDAQSALATTLRNLPKLLDSEYGQALASEKDFENAMHDQEKQALALNKQAIQYNALLRELETDRALYESLLRRLKETDVAKGVDTGNLRIFESAALPLGPTDRKANSFLMIGIAGGLALGIGAVFGGHLLDSSWKTVDQAESATSLRVLASIPRCRRLKPVRGGSPVLKNPSSATAEAFRFLRTSLQVASRKNGHTTFLFTSALPEEGKTLCAINYAIASAQQGLRTLIIDADLRSPMVGAILLSEPAMTGLGEYIVDGVTIETAIHESSVPNLSVLPAGRNAQNPSEMLGSSQFAGLIAEARTQFDCIVVDSAPILAVSDTLLIVEYADAVCLVVRAGRTARKVVLRACQVLSEFSIKPVGMVMNAVPERAITPYYCAVGSYGKRAYREERRN